MRAAWLTCGRAGARGTPARPGEEHPVERALRVPVALALLLELAAADPIELMRQQRDPVSRPAYEKGNCQTASSSDNFLAKRTDHEAAAQRLPGRHRVSPKGSRPRSSGKLHLDPAA